MILSIKPYRFANKITSTFFTPPKYLLFKGFLFQPQNVEIVVFYLLLISLFLFFPFFLYHAHSSCFPNPYPNPQAFPRSFYGSHLALILSLMDRTCAWTVVMANLQTIRFCRSDYAHFTLKQRGHSWIKYSVHIE